MTEQDDNPARDGEGEPPHAHQRFEIEWFEETGQTKSGGFFAEPSPEPPKQPFEIVRDRAAPARQTSAPSQAPTAPLAQQPLRRDSRPPLPLRLFWGLLPILLMLGGYASVVLTQGKVGMAWDEAYYYEASMHAADWLASALRGEKVYSAEAVDAAWGGEENHPEHPGLVKLAMGIAIRLFPNPRDHLYAMRLPAAIFFGLSLTLIYLLGRRAWGTWPGLAASMIFAAMPRIFGHAHFGSYEMPLVCVTLLLVFCYLRGLDSGVWALFTGLVFGLALATKINAFFLPIPLILWSHLYARGKYVNNLFAMLIAGPPAMLAVWPWLWPDPAARLLAYLQFHAGHQQTAVYFFHQTYGYGGPNAPWYYPFFIVGATIPLLSLVLITAGAVFTLMKIPRRPYAALFLLFAAFLLAVASAPSVPKYDGERLFLAVFPFLALLGGAAFAMMLSRLERLDLRMARQGKRMTFRASRMASVAMLLMIAIEGVWAEVRYHPFNLSYFNHAIGGLKGAGRMGLEVAYWGESINLEVVETLNRLPDGSKVKPLALHEKCLNLYQEWEYLKPEITIGGPPPYDYHLIQMRRGFFRTAEKELVDSNRYDVVEQWDVHGVTLAALYRTGPQFERQGNQ